MDDELGERLGAAAYQRTGFAADYDRNRPHPPPALLELLPTLARFDRPRLVVDLGSGSGSLRASGRSRPRRWSASS